MNPLYQCTLNK